ncbi:MAG: hypothetical protein Q4F66_09525 [Clostridium sp.]|nr:hypothetical protein [Clostridium sp.]
MTDTDKKLINQKSLPIVPPSQSFLAPLLSEQIADCFSFEKDQFLYTRGQIVNIDTENVTYLNGSAICINEANITYSCIGLTLPITFRLCGSQNAFDIDGSGCNCITYTDTLPVFIQDLINNTLSEANSAIGNAENVFSASTVVQKSQNAYNAALIASQAALDASNTIQALFNYSYSDPAENTVEKALQYLNRGVNYLALAQTKAAEYVNDTAEITANRAAILSDLNNSLINFGLAAGEVQEITTPAPPQAAISASNRALTLVTSTQTLIDNFDATPNWNTLSTAIDNLYLVGRYAQQAVDITASDSGASPAEQYADSLSLILYSIFTAQDADDSLYRSYTATGTSQIRLLDSSADYSIQSANYTKQSVYYPNTEVETTYTFYNNFIAQASLCQCLNKNCCSPPCSDPSKALFYQSIYPFYLCSPQINISGTIGSEPFTGHISYPAITSLEDLGLNPIILDYFICHPQNICNLTLRENFDSCYTIQCVYPTGSYNSTEPSTFLADVYSYFNLKGNLIATVRNPVAALSSTDPVNCPHSN